MFPQDPVQARGWLIVTSKGGGLDDKNRARIQEMRDKRAAVPASDRQSRANQRFPTTRGDHAVFATDPAATTTLSAGAEDTLAGLSNVTEK